ncbi:hypothetical protein [Paraburkholderia tropica]|uniref:hypothetical protein n=1 Tax=Paraburkholderia tropica TaxID=92647 RepID=UPI002AB653E8|nr:hypothetical protein [Paraburkholderia tropica]
MKIKTIKQKVFLLLILISQGAFAEASFQPLGVPAIKAQTPYGKVRQIMLKHGWSPYHGENALPCAQDDQRCQGRPEMQACSDVGLGQCTWLWKKNGKIIVIDTQDDDLFQRATPFYGK